MKRLIIYTDGSANNMVPLEERAAGYAALFYHSEDESTWDVFTGAQGGINTYQAELGGAILALCKVLEYGFEKRPITIICDNSSVVDAYRLNWIEKWRFHNFSGRDKYAKLLDEIITENNLNVNFKWVRGHSGIPANERCDTEAKSARERLKKRNPKFK